MIGTSYLNPYFLNMAFGFSFPDATVANYGWNILILILLIINFTLPSVFSLKVVTRSKM